MPTDVPSESVVLTLLGGREAHLSKPEKGWPLAVQLEVSGGGMATYREAKWPIGSLPARKRLVREANLVESDVQQIEDTAVRFIQEQQATEAAVKAAATEALESFEVIAHAPATGHENAFIVQSMSEFLKLLAQPQGEGVYLRWKNRQLCSVVDADFHGERKPLARDIENWMRNLSPAPLAVHTTARGFHAIYGPAEGYTAEELAVAAKAQLLSDPSFKYWGGTCEVLTRTRHPKSLHNGRTYGMLIPCVPDAIMPVLYTLDEAGADEGEREEAMQHYGWRLGERLAHDSCPIDPAHHSKSPAPVCITEKGVFCYSCAARGMGFLSWNELRVKAGLPTKVNGDTKVLRDALHRWAPHAHVSRMLEVLLPNMEIVHHRVLHRCLLKRTHGADAAGLELRLGAVLQPFPFVRGAEGRWLHADTLQLVEPRLDRAAVQQCSYVQALVDDPEDGPSLKPDASLVTVLAANGNVPGLYPITPLVASPIWHIHNRPDRNGALPAIPRDPHRQRLRYLAPSERMPRKAAEDAIQARWPGINLAYLSLLHIARGLGEEGRCQMPIIWAMGPTSTGKTTHVHIEAALHDETPENIIFDDKMGRATDMLGEMQARTGMALLDDFGKNLDGRAGQERLDNIISFILQYSRSVTFHHRHVGMRSVAVKTALVLTDMRQPPKLVQSEQVGRRVVVVQLNQKVDWHGENGQLSGVRNWWRANEELQRAAESWHSHLIDEFFPEGGGTSFFAHAQKLGFATLAKHFADDDISQSKESLVRDFVLALLHAPPAPDNLQRAQGRGCVEIQPTALTPLTNAAMTLCEMMGSDGIEWWSLKGSIEPYQSKMHELVPFAEPVHVDIRKHGRRIIARITPERRSYANGGAIAPGRYGAELLLPGVTLANLHTFTWEAA